VGVRHQAEIHGEFPGVSGYILHQVFAAHLFLPLDQEFHIHRQGSTILQQRRHRSHLNKELSFMSDAPRA
jgi:hypothetical protein